MSHIILYVSLFYMSHIILYVSYYFICLILFYMSHIILYVSYYFNLEFFPLSHEYTVCPALFACRTIA